MSHLPRVIFTPSYPSCKALMICTREVIIVFFALSNLKVTFHLRFLVGKREKYCVRVVRRVLPEKADYDTLYTCTIYYSLIGAQYKMHKLYSGCTIKLHLKSCTKKSAQFDILFLGAQPFPCTILKCPIVRMPK